MFCTYVQYRLSGALDVGEDIPPRVRRHLSRCERCAAIEQGMARVDLSLRAGANGAAPPRAPVTGGVGGRTGDGAERTPGRARWPLVAGALSVTAAVALVFALGGRGPSGLSPDGAQDSAQEAAVVGAPPRSGAPLRSHTSRADDPTWDLGAASAADRDDATRAGRFGPEVARARAVAERGLAVVLTATPLEDELDALLTDGRRGALAVLRAGGLRN